MRRPHQQTQENLRGDQGKDGPKGQLTAIQLALTEARRVREEQMLASENKDFISWKDIDSKGNLLFTLDGAFETQYDKPNRPRNTYRTKTAVLTSKEFTDSVKLENMRLPDSTRMTNSINEAIKQGHHFALVSEHENRSYDDNGTQRNYHDFLFISRPTGDEMLGRYFK